MTQEAGLVFFPFVYQKQTKWQQFSELLFIRVEREHSQRSPPRRIFIHWCINICLPAVRLGSPENKNIMAVKFTARYDFPHCPKMGTQTIWYPCLAENWVMSAHYKGNTWWSLPSAFHFPKKWWLLSTWVAWSLLVALYSVLSFFLFILFSFGYDPKEDFSWCFPPPALFINYPSPHDVLSYLQLRIVSTKDNAASEGNGQRKKNLEQII